MVGKGEAVINKRMQGLAAVGLAVLLGTAGCASQPQGADPHASASLQTAVDSSSREKEDSSLPSSSRDAAGEPGAASKLPRPEGYSWVMAGADGYHLVVKQEDSPSGASYQIGTINNKGEWVHPLRADHIFLSVESGWASQPIYLGDGVFTIKYATTSDRLSSFLMYNAKEDIGFDAGPCSDINGFHDGYLVVRGSNGTPAPVKIISSTGEITEPGLKAEGEIGLYSEGVFYLDGRFYNLAGEAVIDLSEYRIANIPMFENNKCYIELRTRCGEVSYTEIDHEGNFLYEPHRSTLSDP